jgi:hypothetical protein
MVDIIMRTIRMMDENLGLPDFTINETDSAD